MKRFNKGVTVMAISLEDIESEIKSLPKGKLMQFRKWYLKFDAEIWDNQIEQDVVSSKLDGIAEA